MKTLVVVLTIIIALYFFALANLYFWGSLLGSFTGAYAQPELFPWRFFVNILLVPFLMYGAIMFLRKTKSKYVYGLVLLLLLWLDTLIYRFFFVTEGKLEMTDLSNLAFFGIPFSIVYLTKYLNTKYVSWN